MFKMREIQLSKAVFVSWTVFGISLACFHAIFSIFFPLPGGTLGHDYSLALPAYYDGFLWFKNNGMFAVPWFTPSFCGGQPFFADPQSAYYSLPQWLSFVLEPVTAIYVSLLVLATLAFWGVYLLSRDVFQLTCWAACLAAVVFMFNGFFTHRMITGHVGFQGLVLIPWISLMLLRVKEIPIGPVSTGGNALLAGLLVAYWFQSAMGSLVIPASLAVLVIAAIAGVRGHLQLTRFLGRSALAAVIALGLSISKINAGVSFLAHFPRDGYRLPGMDGFVTSLEMVLRALSSSSQSTFERGQEVMLNQQWLVGPHEWSYGLTPVPVILVGCGALLFLYRLPNFRFSSPLSLVSLVVAAIVLLVPVFINIYTPEWNAILKRQPVIGSSSSLVRWYLIYILPLSLMAAITIDQLSISGKVKAAMVCSCLVLIVGFKAFEDRRYYFQEGASYSIDPVTRYWPVAERAQSEIRMVARALPDVGLFGNNVIFAGASQLSCYNPIFGYRLEYFPKKSIREGSPSTVDENKFNFKNPACYVFPEENQCEPGDHFHGSQGEKLNQILSYKPFEFSISVGQKIFNRVTKMTLLISVSLLLLMIVWPVFRRR